MRSLGTSLFVLVVLVVLIGKMTRDNRPKPPVEPNLPAIMKNLEETGRRHEEIIRKMEDDSRRAILEMSKHGTIFDPDLLRKTVSDGDESR